MSTRNVPCQCKICHKNMHVEIDNDYFGNLEPLLAMATCNKCYDLRDKHLRSVANIESRCTYLVQNPDIKADERKKVYQKLAYWTKQYAEAVAAFNHSAKIVWSEEFAQILMDKPENWYEALRIYRHNVRESATLV